MERIFKAALFEDHQFDSAIKEDIVEKLGSLWDVKKVDVVFTAL